MRFLLAGALALTAAASPAQAVTLTFEPGTFQVLSSEVNFNYWQSGNFTIGVSPDGTIANGVATGSTFVIAYQVADRLIPLNNFDVQGTGQIGVQAAVVSGIPLIDIPVVPYALTGLPQTVSVDPKIPGFLFYFTTTLGPVAIDNIDFGTAVAVHIPSYGVPEPASWAMMIAGFGLAGAAARRRKPAMPQPQ